MSKRYEDGTRPEDYPLELSQSAEKRNLAPHTLARVHQAEINRDEGVISQKKYEKRIKDYAKQKGIPVSQLDTTLTDSWHIYSASQGFNSNISVLSFQDGHAGFGVNGQRRIVPIDKVTQTWNAFERSLGNFESKIRKSWIKAKEGGYSAPLTKNLRILYDKIGPRIGRTYPLMGEFFQNTTPLLQYFLEKFNVDYSQEYRPDSEAVETQIADIILETEKNRIPLYTTSLAIENKNKPFILVYGWNDTSKHSPLWLSDQAQWSLLDHWLHGSNVFSPVIFSDPVSTAHFDKDHYLPTAILMPEQATELYARPNGKIFNTVDFLRMPKIYPSPKFGTSKDYNSGEDVMAPDLFIPHFAAIPLAQESVIFQR